MLIVVYSIRASGRLEDDVYGGLGGGVSGNVFAGLVYGCIEEEDCNEGILALIVVYSIRVIGRLEEDVHGGLVYGCLEEEECERRGICDDCDLDRGGISIG